MRFQESIDNQVEVYKLEYEKSYSYRSRTQSVGKLGISTMCYSVSVIPMLLIVS